MVNDPHTPTEYRKRAAEVRAAVKHQGDAGTKQTLLHVADSYERLANLLEKQAQDRQARKPN